MCNIYTYKYIYIYIHNIHIYIYIYIYICEGQPQQPPPVPPSPHCGIPVVSLWFLYGRFPGPGPAPWEEEQGGYKLVRNFQTCTPKGLFMLSTDRRPVMKHGLSEGNFAIYLIYLHISSYTLIHLHISSCTSKYSISGKLGPT